MISSYTYAGAQVLSQRHYPVLTDPNIYDEQFYVHDRLGSVRLVVDYNDIDEYVSVANSYTYTPFGSHYDGEDPAETMDNPFKFTGQWLDAEINQYYLRARMYDPTMMRFTSRDPVDGKFGEPLTLHKYLYCRNDGVNLVDPSGRISMAATLINNTIKRPYLEHQGRTYEALNGAGGVTALESMVTLTNLVAGFYQNGGANRTGFVEDLLWMFTERSGPNLSRVSENLDLRFDDTGFRSRYRDGGNQVRHFIGCMAAGYYNGPLGGRAMVIGNEITGTFSWADVWLGFEGVNLGEAISKNIWGTYVLDIGNVGDWMESRLGE